MYIIKSVLQNMVNVQAISDIIMPEVKHDSADPKFDAFDLPNVLLISLF